MTKREIVALDQIQRRIFTLRGHRVLLDADLASFYSVPTKALNQALKRNADRFPADFCFQLTNEEVAILRSQIVTSSWGHGGLRYQPFAFTEHGALMAATVLNSPRAVQMSLVVIRAFVALRRMVSDQKAFSEKLTELDARVGSHDEQLVEIVEASIAYSRSQNTRHTYGTFSHSPLSGLNFSTSGVPSLPSAL